MSAKDVSGKRPNQKRALDIKEEPIDQNVEDYYGIGHLNDNEKRIIKAYEQDMELCKRKKKTVNNYWKPHKCPICEKVFCHEDSLKQHIVDLYDEKKAQISKKKMSKKKKKHLKDKNVVEVEEDRKNQ